MVLKVLNNTVEMHINDLQPVQQLSEFNSIKPPQMEEGTRIASLRKHIPGHRQCREAINIVTGKNRLSEARKWRRVITTDRQVKFAIIDKNKNKIG